MSREDNAGLPVVQGNRTSGSPFLNTWKPSRRSMSSWPPRAQRSCKARGLAIGKADQVRSGRRRQGAEVAGHPFSLGRSWGAR